MAMYEASNLIEFRHPRLGETHHAYLSRNGIERHLPLPAQPKRERLRNPAELLAAYFRKRAKLRMARLPKVLVGLRVLDPAGTPAVRILLD